MKLDLLYPTPAIECIVCAKLKVMLYIQDYTFILSYGSYTNPNTYYVQVVHDYISIEIKEFDSIRDVISFIRNTAPDGDIEMEVLS